MLFFLFIVGFKIVLRFYWRLFLFFMLYEKLLESFWMILCYMNLF